MAETEIQCWIPEMKLKIVYNVSSTNAMGKKQPAADRGWWKKWKQTKPGKKNEGMKRGAYAVCKRSA